MNRKLGNQLIGEHIENRLMNPKAIQKSVRSGLTAIGYDVASIGDIVDEPVSKKRCTICPRAKDRKTKSVCSSCFRNVCKEHSSSILICEDCSESSNS